MNLVQQRQNKVVVRNAFRRVADPRRLDVLEVHSGFFRLYWLVYLVEGLRLPFEISEALLQHKSVVGSI